MKITKIILLTIIFSIYTLQASALVFNNFSSGGAAGSVNTGNGYFDNEADIFGYTGNRNVYVVGENAEVWLFEPISYNSGAGSAYKLINSSLRTIKDAVVHNGYLYFIDGTTLKKKKTRSVSNVCESTDTSGGGCISVIASGVSPTIKVTNNILYYIVNDITLTHLDEDDNGVVDFNLPAAPGAGNPRQGFVVAMNNSNIQTYSLTLVSSVIRLQICTSSGCYTPAVTFGANAVTYLTGYEKSSTVYIHMYNSGQGGVESGYYKSNSSTYVESIITENSVNTARPNRAYVGGKTTVGLWAGYSTYTTYSSNEIGVGSEPTFPVELTYDLLELSSVQTSYYNNTNIQIVEALQLTFADNVLLWGGIDNNYRWRVDLIDPSNIPILSFTTGACNGLLSCSVTNVITFQPPETNWTAGTYRARMYEVNIVAGTSALLATSTAFTVLNNSSGGGSVAPGTGGGGQDGGIANTNTALKLISVFSMTAFWGFVIWLGIIGSVIITMSKNPSGVNGTAVIVVAWLSAIMIALVGLFDPYKIYIIIMSTIISAVMFRYGRTATVED